METVEINHLSVHRKITREAFEEKDVLVNIIEGLDMNLRAKGKKLDMYYYTFVQDDFITNYISVFGFSNTQRHLKINVPEEGLTEAIVWVVDNNPGLDFRGERTFGYENNDFECGRKTAVLPFIKK